MPRTRGYTAKQKAESRSNTWSARCLKIVKRLMAAHDLSQRKLAELLQISDSAMSHRMSGKVGIPAYDLMVIADYTNADTVTRAALLGGKEKCIWEM